MSTKRNRKQSSRRGSQLQEIVMTALLAGVAYGAQQLLERRGRGQDVFGLLGGGRRRQRGE